jgi:uncharacterized protein (TIGR02466 family)
MVNVNKHEIFPTMVYQFNCGFDDLKAVDITQMNTYILANEREDYVNQSKDGLQTLSTFRNLTDIVYDQNKKYLTDLEYEFDEIEITSMWSNHLKPGQSHPPHTHSNNLLSGVFYLHSEFPATPIQFFDPRPQANILSPRNEPNKYNASMVQFNCLPCTGYIFPAWLQHWVPPTPVDRVSISWNILVRGQYGETEAFQNANI